MFALARTSFHQRVIPSRSYCSSPTVLDGVVIGRWQDGSFTEQGKKINEATNGHLEEIWKLTAKKGKSGEGLLYFQTSVSNLPPRIAVIGLGKPSEVDGKKRETIRKAADAGTKMLRHNGAHRVGVEDFGDALAASEGVHLGQYQYRPGEEDRPVQVLPYEMDENSWNKGKKLAEAVNLTRHLTETPSNLMTPSIFAEKASQALSGASHVKVEVHDKDWIQSEKMGCLLGVSQGSAEPPRFVEIDYAPPGADSSPPIVLIGKGVTFDSGGISIKSASGMGLMRTDMAGAASVVGTVLALSHLQIPRRVVGLMPLCENMPSGTAIKPGDVITSRNGKTIEVDNTDAEGRLILADALNYSSKFKPDFIVDIATLTGAIKIAIGKMTGVFSNDDHLWNQFKISSENSSEPMWRMPLDPEEFKSVLKSEIADLKNSVPGPGSCTAAAFLSNFVPASTRWIHLDIAGSARLDKPNGYLTTSTGTPVRTLVDLLSRWNK
eukprot:TRINITY_DN8456_c0_g1_i1.p1 TRINITY_DN8456_c0_g1~~TRINITY_DN8456_c0_g1_i1.p1  ORF type:complete len:493 (+),score=73.77 TRINITY_DN8456_c0_g1_i1:32-1510(+)